MIYRLCRKLRAALYNALVQPAIRRSFAACGRGTKISKGGDFYPLSHIHIGSHVSIGPDARFWTSVAHLYIDDFAVFGPRVTVITGDHRTDAVGKYIAELTDADKLPENDSDVTIGAGAWIGANVTILKGVHIGRESVIAAGSVVTHDIPPLHRCRGCPRALYSGSIYSRAVKPTYFRNRITGKEPVPRRSAAASPERFMKAKNPIYVHTKET